MDDRKQFSRLTKTLLLASLTLAFAVSSTASAQTIYEVWTPQIDNQSSGGKFGTCYFRKKLSLVDPAEAEIYLSAKDDYELFVNGNRVHFGRSEGEPQKFIVTESLQAGLNVIAVQVRHQKSTTAGLALKFRIRENGEKRWRSLATDDSWKTRVGARADWFKTEFNDQDWENANKLAAVSFNTNQIQTQNVTSSQNTPVNPMMQASSQTASATTTFQDNPPSPTASSAPTETFSGPPNVQSVPVNDPVQNVTAPNTVADNSIADRLATTDEQPSQANVSDMKAEANPTVKASNAATKSMTDRFTVDSEFTVEQIMPNSETGSVIAMAFNEFGQLILSQEGGPLLLADMTKEPGDPQRVYTLCDQVTTCQGILPLNGKIYVTGDGPSGLGLYRLADSDRNGRFEIEQKLLPFTGELSEHGPHGIELGPDGMIYVTIGNASQCDVQPKSTSPFLNSYEGDLVPRVEDPGGHAIGVKAPGGTIIRTSLDGTQVETVCGGIRNAYDLVFDQFGELFIHDSDLETNMGMAWYRPTRIYHVPQGAELGWRSGWSKFPNYFTDVTAPVMETGRGSPSGAVIYQHYQFPQRYHNNLFLADWSEGRILAVRPKQKGSTYEVDVDVFLTGRPLNVTDLAVGTDGDLFFCTGGRGTDGGVYRVKWNGEVPEELYAYNNDFERVIRMPQPSSAWGRQATALLKQQLTAEWETALSGVASDTRNNIAYRLRAIELLFFFGPFPSDELVSTLAQDEDPNVRARIASLCGAKTKPTLNQNLANLISDPDPRVRRRAAESYIRLGTRPEVGKVLAMLGTGDRAEAMVARRLLERTPVSEYSEKTFKTEEAAVFTHGALAMMTATPTLENAYQVLARATHFMDGYLTDVEFADLLRVVQVALVQGQVDATKIPGLGDRIASEFPAGNGTLNKQLAMIMAFMRNAQVDNRMSEYFTHGTNNNVDKLFVAMQLQTINSELNDTQRFALVDFLEQSIQRQPGSTYQTYIGTAIQNLAKLCNRPEQIQQVLENGARWPNAMLHTFFNLDGKLSAEQVQWVIAADRGMPDGDNLMTRRIRLGVIAVLAESQDPAAFEYLRSLWQSRKGYRSEIALGLAQSPTEDNWAYLVTSLPILDDMIGVEIVNALAQTNRRPTQARQYRELIEMGFRLRENGGLAVSKLLEHWSGQKVEPVSSNEPAWRNALQFWTSWYQEKWPADLKINQAVAAKVGNFSAEQVLEHLEKFESQGDVLSGRGVFYRANCHACHRIGNEGASFGPDLSNLASRFSQREILESIVHPSRVVSDQYRSKKVLTVDGEQLFGMMTLDSSGEYLLLDPEGRTTRIAATDIEETTDTELSSMPENLLDNMTLNEILNLFAFLTKQDDRGPLVSSTGEMPAKDIR